MQAGIDWSARAAAVEHAIVRRYVRRVAGFLPGTRIGRVHWPRPVPALPGQWNYWWQAHLIDCLLDAQSRAPSARRAAAIRAYVRGVWVRNGASWTNSYYDDIAWLGLAIERAGPLAGRARAPALAAITAQLRSGWSDAAGGGIYWRRGDDYKAAPANGPAAILLARTGQVGLAAAIVDWMAATLADPDTGLVRDGVRTDLQGRIRAVEPAVYTYCQGVYLGACIELADTDGDPRWRRRAGEVLEAVATRIVDRHDVVTGGGPGDGGLFNGILARYLADAALRRPGLAPVAERILRASAAAAWHGRAEVTGGPVFSPDWRLPARSPGPGVPEADLSVQLSAWMLTEATAVVGRVRGAGR